MAKKDEQKASTAIVAPETNTGITVFEYGDDYGKGYENQGKADMSVPFINMLQALSPLVAAEKARPGDYFNTVTEEIFPREKGFLFVAGGTRRAFAEWVPRNNPDGSTKTDGGSGGYRGEHAVESPVVAAAIKASVKFGKFFTPDGNVLRDTFYVYGCLCGEDGVNSMAIMPFWSTKIKPYRAWMTRLRQMNLQQNYELQIKRTEEAIAAGQGDRKELETMLATYRRDHGKTILGPDGKPARPPLYAHLTRFTSVMTQNASKQSFYIPAIASADPRGLMYSLIAPNDERFQMAKECKQLFESGEAKVDYSKADTSGDDDADPGHPFGD